MGLIFDNVDLEIAFGVLVNGSGSWPKPERDRELVHVPGRSGDLIYDNGSWLNVEVPYSIFIKEDFRSKYEEFCEWLCSHVGYFRLEDPDRHPGVYRMAEFAGPLDPKAWQLSNSGVVEIVFNCKPQQWLIDGERPVEVNTTTYVSGYFDSSGNWQTGSGVSTALINRNSASDLHVTITNNSDEAKTVILGHGIYSARDTLTSATSTSYSVSAGGTQTATLAKNGTFMRVSIYSADGLDGLSLKIESNLSYDIIIDCDELFTTLENPTYYNAFPLISFYHTEGTVNINGFAVTAEQAYEPGSPIPLDAPIYVDCELEDCYYIYDGEVYNHNGSVTISNANPRELRDFPYLKPGANDLYFGPVSQYASVREAGQETVTVVPRWFRI